MYNIFAAIISIICPILLIVKDIKLSKNIKEFIKINKYEIIICYILIMGLLVRLYGITNYPYGFNQDEASEGYEAYSIAKFGIDRKGKSFPVNYISWGSGQNVLYSYFIIPFIYLIGLNALSTRFPMALVGSISLILVYKFFKRYDKKLMILGTAFFAICPWHIMKSRWALESNLFPDLVLWATYIIINAINNKKTYQFQIGIALLSMSVYSYGTSYAFLPIYILILLIYLIKAKYITVKTSLISILISGIIAFPMVLFVAINTFDLNEIKIGIITIPRLYENRYESTTTIFSSDFFTNITANFINNLKILITGSDLTSYNSLPYFGIIYFFSLPFTILGIFDSIKNKTIEKNILNIWFVASLVLTFIMLNANINRLNICIIPLIFYTIIGLYNIVRLNNHIAIPIVSMYIIAFILFKNSYIEAMGANKNIFEKDVEGAIVYISSLDVDNIYITNYFAEPYIYTLFYTQYPTPDFISTVKYNSEKVAFESINSFGKYHFYIPNTLDYENSAYMVIDNFPYPYHADKFVMEDFGRFKVFSPKK